MMNKNVVKPSLKNAKYALIEALTDDYNYIWNTI